MVQYCAHLLGYKDLFVDYILLGDDIVIHNDLVAQKYIQIMSDLGVDVSFNKTHTSPTCWEFAKR